MGMAKTEVKTARKVKYNFIFAASLISGKILVEVRAAKGWTSEIFFILMFS